MRPKENALPRSRRLRKRFDYLATRKQGRRLHTPHFIILLNHNDTPHRRLGITVTKKIGSAVRRNRIKRLVREVYRQNLQLFPENMDIVFIAKPGAAALNYQAVEQEVMQVSGRMRSARGGRAR